MRTSIGRAFVALVVATGLAGSTVARAQLFGNDEDRSKFGTAPGVPAAKVPPGPAKVAPPPSAVATPPAAAVPPVSAEAEAAKREADEEKAQAAARQSQVDELGADVKEFESQVREYRGDVQLMIERRFQAEKARVSGAYEKGIRELETGERQERLDAIALFERFLVRYPEDEKYTPDAMTRLAELYYEKSVDDQQVALSEYEERAKLGAEEAPPEATRSFEKSIALYQQLITKFPRYRLIDSIYYLLGWCLNEQGEPEQSRDTFRVLIDKYPKSKYVPEAWVRIGEYYFDDTGPGDPNDKLRLAIAAYTNAIQFKDSSLYDKALYKLGWAYYRLDDFDRGVDAFTALIDYYNLLAKDGKEGSGDLRAEALQYTAISFADDKWGGTEKNPDGTDRFLGVQKMADYFKAKGGRSYEYELFRKLGDVLFDSTKYEAAVEAYRIVIERNPTAADAPQTQERIVQCFARAGDKEKAFAERQKLVDGYGETSVWAKANKGDHEVLKAATDLVEKSLLATAQFHHQQAEEYDKQAEDAEATAEKKQQATVLAFQSYQKAAKAYGDYLTAFPHSKNLYDIQYLHAETLYRSLQFMEAANEYATVRDSNADNKYLANAAYYVVLALQREIEKQETQGLLEKKDPCAGETCKGITDFSELVIPEIRTRLIASADLYMQKIPTAEDAPILSYKAAQTFFTYFHFDEARKRYEDVIRRFPDNEVATRAYEDISITYLLVKDWLNVEKFADRMIKESKAIQADPEKLKQKRLLKYGARFERANIAMSAKKWNDAATLYMSIVDETEAEKAKYGDWENADAALFDAATCYKEYRKFDSAMRTYERLYKTFPKSPLAERALFFVAENAEKAFEYDKAIEGYMLLFKNYPQSKDRVGALFNASKLLEALQRYKEAADAYKLYAKTFASESDAPDMAYQATVMYQRMKDYKALIGGLNNFIDNFKTKTEQAEKIVQAWQKIGHANHELGNEGAALESYRKCVAEYDRLKMTPQNYLAASAAAESQFVLTELKWADFQKMKFDPKGKGSKLEKSMKDGLEGLANKLGETKKAYTEVIVKYQWPEWMMASLFRMGNLDEEFANKLLNSPCPAEVKAIGGEEACTEYRIQLEEQVAPINDRAQLSYETAQDKAIGLRISNEWTKLTNEKVCQVSPSKCLSLKDPRAKLIIEDMSAKPLAADAKGVTAVVYPSNAAAQGPVIAEVKPRKASPGDSLVIVGQNFNGEAAAIAVTMGEATLQVTAATPTRLTVTVPAEAKTATVTVQTQAGTYSTAFQVEIGLAQAPAIGSPAAVTPGAPAPGLGDVAKPAAAAAPAGGRSP